MSSKRKGGFAVAIPARCVIGMKCAEEEQRGNAGGRRDAPFAMREEGRLYAHPVERSGR
jgi:hypothetical protein